MLTGDPRRGLTKREGEGEREREVSHNSLEKWNFFDIFFFFSFLFFFSSFFFFFFFQ